MHIKCASFAQFAGYGYGTVVLHDHSQNVRQAKAKTLYIMNVAGWYTVKLIKDFTLVLF